MQSPVNKNIRTLRLLLGLTQTEFAEHIGIDATQLSRIETGDRVVNAALVEKITKRVPIKVHRIFDTDFLSVLTNQEAA